MAKKSLRERMEKKHGDLKSRRSSGDIHFLKADEEVRIRILNMGPENEFIKEVTQFYLGSEIKGVISPDTFGEPCAIHEAYMELKNSDDDGEVELAGKFPPRNKYLAYCAFYKDAKGGDLDMDKSPRFLLLTAGLYQDILELYLDEDDWGDMTDPDNGYDLKVKRTGSGKMDTEYTVKATKISKCPKEFYSKVYDLDEEVRKLMPSYEKTKELIAQYLGLDSDTEEEAPRKKKVIKKKRTRDTD